MRVLVQLALIDLRTLKTWGKMYFEIFASKTLSNPTNRILGTTFQIAGCNLHRAVIGPQV